MMWEYALPLLKGAVVTLEVSFTALFLGIFLALLFCLGESASWKIVKWIFVGLTTILRGLPELLVMFTIYFGSTILLTNIMGHYVNVNAFISGVIALSLIFAAYGAQVLRGAYQSIPKGQTESALALGLNRKMVLQKIILPQMWKYALSGFSNLWLILLKDSALVSLIGLSDLMNITYAAASQTSLPFNFYCIAGMIYLIFTVISQYGIQHIKRLQNKDILCG